MASETTAKSTADAPALDTLAEKFARLFSQALRTYAEIGLTAREAALDLAAPQEPVRSTKIGRNVPCPCGSGKKYKKCCGA